MIASSNCFKKLLSFAFFSKDHDSSGFMSWGKPLFGIFFRKREKKAKKRSLNIYRFE